MQQLKNKLINDFGGHEVVVAQDNHTPAFRQYKNLLVWKSYKFEAPIPVELCMFTKAEMSQEDLANIYFMTKYMRDEELTEINDERLSQGLQKLPRVARASGGRYVVCQSQKDRVFREAQIAANIPAGGVGRVVETVSAQLDF